MAEKAKITIEHDELNVKENYELYLNEAFSLINRKDTITITLPNKWVVKIKFIDDDNAKEGNTKMEFEGNTVTLSLNKWYNEYWLENTKPYHIFSKAAPVNMDLHIMVRSTASKIQNNRIVHVSIWKKL